MIARSAYVQLRYNPALLAGTLIGLLLLYAVPPAGVIAALIAAAVGATGSAVAVTGIAGLLGWALMTRQLPADAPLLPAVAAARPGAAADRVAVRRDDGRLRPPPLFRPGRLLARPRGRPGLTELSERLVRPVPWRGTAGAEAG